jgi:CRISPR-associated endonuclease Cas1
MTPTAAQQRGPDSAVVVVDGYGIALSVRRGRLVIDDGLGTARRSRELSRIDRDVKRIVILSDTGTVTLDAVRWCADVGIAIVQLDRDGRLLLSACTPGTNDPRIRRAQAAAATGDAGLTIGRALIDTKIRGQASVAASLSSSATGELLRLADEAAQAPDLRHITRVESAAANLYFAVWSGTVSCRLTANDQNRFPAHWATFTTRNSPLHEGKTNRSAADPINALLNYGYALAEAEARIAAIKVGLDPGLGIIHTDSRARDSMALDLLEPLRPIVDQHVLDLLAVRHLSYTDVAETRTGQCRLLPPLTEHMCGLMPLLARAAGPIAEQVAHAVARSHPGKIELRTPLSRANTRSTQVLGSRATSRRPPTGPVLRPTCRVCGAQLFDAKRQLCSTCWPVHRAALAHRRALAGQQALAAARAAGSDPAQTEAAKVRRHDSLTRSRAMQARWEAEAVQPAVSEQMLHERVLPTLRKVPLRQIQEATGLSNSAASRIRSQKLTPHPRHWDALARLSQGSKGPAGPPWVSRLDSAATASHAAVVVERSPSGSGIREEFQ